ncbi:MAG: hypothetical protein HYT93_01050 [Parcubacteria group bacterium]|nr:hypothetical protein [Parcubacteria group bacterium]
MKIFLVCPVTNASKKTNAKIAKYVKQLEKQGHRVHWPTLDTEQDDPTGGVNICRTNFQAILDADEVHIWYDEKSYGSKFDMGGVFMLTEMLGIRKRVVVANEVEIKNGPDKSFFLVMKHMAEK